MSKFGFQSKPLFPKKPFKGTFKQNQDFNHKALVLSGNKAIIDNTGVMKPSVYTPPYQRHVVVRPLNSTFGKIFQKASSAIKKGVTKTNTKKTVEAKKIINNTMESKSIISDAKLSIGKKLITWAVPVLLALVLLKLLFKKKGR